MAFGFPRIFISYRRTDSAGSSGRLADRLDQHFEHVAHVFFDSERLHAGDDFERVITKEITEADVVVVVIGPDWLSAENAAGRRLDQERDWVRYELALALDLDKRIVPVLVGNASPPAAEELPPALAKLARLHMFAVRDATFGPDFEALVEQLLKRSHHRLLAELDRLLMLVRNGGAAAIAPFVALLAVLGVWSGAFDWLHIDTHVQRGLLTFTPPVMSGPVLIAAIDADSERRLERRWDDLSQVGAWRRGHALVIDRAAAAGARAVVFDLAFDCRRPGDPCEPAPLDAIAAAARRAAQRHPPMNVVFAVRSRGAAGPDIATPLRGVGSTGAACLNNRGDGALWSVPLAVLRGDAGGRDVVAADTPALAVAALVDAPLRSVDLQRRVMAFDGPPRDPPLGFSAIERRRDPLPGCPLIAHDDLEAALLLRPAPAGHWRTPARQLSYGDLLAARAMEAVLADRIVLVGATALTRPDANKDVHAVQEGLSTRLVYGVELHADAIATLATGRVPRLPGVGLQLAVALAASVAGAVIALVGHYWAAYRRLSTLFAIAAVWVGVCVVLARNDWLMNPGYDLAALLLAYVALRVLQWLARAILLRREA